MHVDAVPEVVQIVEPEVVPEPVRPLPVPPAPSAVPEAPASSTPAPDMARTPASVANPGTSNSMRGIAIAASVVIAVVAIGGLVTWRFLSKGDSTAATPASASVAPATDANPPVSQPVAPAPVAVAPAPSTSASAIHFEPASIAQPVAEEAPPAIVDEPVAAAPRAPVPAVEKPVREKRVSTPPPAPAAPMQDVALTLVRKGESAFSRQDYSTAIANARAALDVNPGLARAKQLLDEAQRAQQQAMNSISIQ